MSADSENETSLLSKLGPADEPCYRKEGVLFRSDRMKITYDTPVVITFATLSLAVLVVDTMTGYWLSRHLLLSPGTFEPLRFGFWTGLIAHIFGHGGASHYVANFSLILILGPILERRYGSALLALMMFFTALATGILNLIFFDHSILGASGIAFMMVGLTPMVAGRAGSIPVTAIIVPVLWIGGEVVAAFTPDEVSRFAHILGGIIGGGFGYLLREFFLDRRE